MSSQPRLSVFLQVLNFKNFKVAADVIIQLNLAFWGKFLCLSSFLWVSFSYSLSLFLLLLCLCVWILFCLSPFLATSSALFFPRPHMISEFYIFYWCYLQKCIFRSILWHLFTTWQSSHEIEFLIISCLPFRYDQSKICDVFIIYRFFALKGLKKSSTLSKMSHEPKNKVKEKN